jgi:hypothetical protein
MQCLVPVLETGMDFSTDQGMDLGMDRVNCRGTCCGKDQ